MIDPRLRKIRLEEEHEQQLTLKKQRHHQRWLKVLKWCGISLLGLTLTLGGVGVYEYHQANQNLPKLNLERLNKKPAMIKVLGNHDQVIYTNQIQEPELINAQNIPKNLTNALLSIEDRDFYHEKHGINWKRTGLSMLHNVTSKNKYGASTIDQQLVKQVVWGNKWKRSYTQKIQELILTVKLNQQLSKNEILAAYYNNLDFGSLKTMQAISKYYCGVPMDQLTLNQAAMLAGMVQAPSAYNPYQHPNAAKKRRNTVLDAMVANHKLTQKQADRIKHEPLHVVDPKVHQDHAKTQKNNLIVDNYAISAALAQGKKLGDDYTIKTTVDPDIQQKVTDIINHFNYPNKKMQTAVTVMDATNGNVVAQVGGVNQTKIGAYNRAIAPNRSCGSTIKPVLDYTSAMHYLGWGTGTLVDDSPYNYPKTSTPLHDWDNKYQGIETVRKALVESRNIPAVKALAEVGLDQSLKMIKPSGYDKALWYADGIGLNTSTQTLASMYTALANGGKMSTARVIDSINGKVQNPVTNQVYSAGTAFMITDILKGVIQPNQLGAKAQIDGVQQAGKTGTIGFGEASNKPDDALSDAWFAGYTPQYVVVVWNGFDDYDGADYLKNGDTPIELYKQIMETLKNSPDWKDDGWQMPNDLVKTGNEYKFKHFVKPADAAKNTPSVPNVAKIPKVDSQVQQQEQQQASQWQNQAKAQSNNNNYRYVTPNVSSSYNTSYNTSGYHSYNANNQNNYSNSYSNANDNYQTNAPTMFSDQTNQVQVP